VVRELLAGLPDRGGTLILRGGSGVGKSSLLAAAEDDAGARGLRVVTVAGVPTECRVAFSGVHTLLGALGRTVEDRGNPVRVALAVLEVFAAQPLLILVDDAQWLDPLSWDVLTFVGRRLAAEPVVLLVAMRDGGETDARLAGLPFARLAVEPLDEADSAAVLGDHAPGLPRHLRERVLAEAEGNPLGLVELAGLVTRLGENGLLPARLPLTTRLERSFAVLVDELPPLTRTLLLVAALSDGDDLGEVLAAGGVVATESAAIEDVEPAAAARLLEVDDSFRVRFRHPLVRSSVYHAANVSQRRRVHAALARVVSHPDRAVWHRAAATIGVDDALADELAALGDKLHGRMASTAWERAARLTGTVDIRAGRLLRAAEAALEVADRDGADRLLRDIVADDLPNGDRSRLMWLREFMMDGGWSGATRVPGQVAIAEQLMRDGRSDQALEALLLVAMRCFWSNPDQRLRDDVVAVVERLDVSPLDPRLVAMLGLVAPVDRGAVVLDRMTTLMNRADLAAEHLHWLAATANAVGALSLSAKFGAEAVAMLRDQGRLGNLAQALVTQAWAAAQLGHTVLGMAAAAEARQLAVETGQLGYAVTAGLVLGHVEALRGNGDIARELAARGERALLSSGAHTMLALVNVARGIEALADARYAEAFETLDQVFDSSDVAFHPHVRFATLSHLAEAGARSDHHDEVWARIRELAPFDTSSPALRVGLVCARALLSPDETALRAALDANLADWPFERARVQLAYGEWLRRRRPKQARPVLRAAATTFEALGALPWAERARAELRASGESRRRPDDGIDQLTPQELQVARLVVAGLSNREIAGRLFLSPRTVSTHLYRIYPKVGISSRAELAGVMARMYVS
jgi:DNA-binding CsgD family transcriptional regulator